MNLSYNEIWKAIDQLARKNGLSVSALAVRAGLDPTIFNPSKRIGKDGRKRWPSTESINKILDATKTSSHDFVCMGGEEKEKIPSSIIPLIGLGENTQTKTFFSQEGIPSGKGLDFIEFPGSLGQNVYAIEINDSSFEPIYRYGDRVIVSPDAEKRRGDRIILKTNDGAILIRELKRATATQIEVSSLNIEREDECFSIKDISFTARILWVSQ